MDDGESYKLIFGEVTTDMHGKYKCIIKNDYGKIEDECNVTVNCKPKIRKVLHDVEVNEGETLTLEVEIYAVPEPKIVWLKDGQEVRADARVKIQRDSVRLETYNLTLNLIKREEAGVYEVKATNALGTAITRSVVTVLSEYSIPFRILSSQNENIWGKSFLICSTNQRQIVSKVIPIKSNQISSTICSFPISSHYFNTLFIF